MLPEKNKEIDISWDFRISAFVNNGQSPEKYMPNGKVLSYYFCGESDRLLNEEELSDLIKTLFCANTYELRDFMYKMKRGCEVIEGFIYEEENPLAKVSVVRSYGRRPINRIFLCFSDLNTGNSFFKIVNPRVLF